MYSFIKNTQMSLIYALGKMYFVLIISVGKKTSKCIAKRRQYKYLGRFTTHHTIYIPHSRFSFENQSNKIRPRIFLSTFIFDVYIKRKKTWMSFFILVLHTYILILKTVPFSCDTEKLKNKEITVYNN